MALHQGLEGLETSVERSRRAGVSFMGTRFDSVTVSQAADLVMEMVESRRAGWVATVNVAILMMMRQDAELRSYVEDSALILADGQPIVWGSRLLGEPLPERVTGVDVIEYLCSSCERDSRSVYFLGGTEDVVGTVASRMSTQYPDLRLGFDHGYFGDEDFATRADAVRAFGADILIVGMGVPRQERFIREQWERLGVGAAIGVGGSFNVIAGSLRRAPAWMQHSGLEWVYRLKQEPRRLFRRYAVTNSLFCVLFAGECAVRLGRSLSSMRRTPSVG